MERLGEADGENLGMLRCGAGREVLGEEKPWEIALRD